MAEPHFKGRMVALGVIALSLACSPVADDGGNSPAAEKTKQTKMTKEFKVDKAQAAFRIIANGSKEVETFLKSDVSKQADQLNTNQKCRLKGGDSVFITRMDPVQKDKNAYLNDRILISVIGIQSSVPGETARCMKIMKSWKETYIHRPHFKPTEEKYLQARVLAHTLLKSSKDQSKKLNWSKKCQIHKGDTVLARKITHHIDDKHLEFSAGGFIFSGDRALVSRCQILDRNFFGYEPHLSVLIATPDLESLQQLSPGVSSCDPNKDKSAGQGKSFFHPLPGSVRTDHYRCRSMVRMHHGHDYGAPIGTPILASASGVIKSRSWAGGYGNLVEMRHPNRNGPFETRYAHMSRFQTLAATHICKGETIGFVGSTGNSTGPHLHFEIRQKISLGTVLNQNPEGLGCKLPVLPGMFQSVNPTRLCANCP